MFMINLEIHSNNLLAKNINSVEKIIVSGREEFEPAI